MIERIKIEFICYHISLYSDLRFEKFDIKIYNNRLLYSGCLSYLVPSWVTYNKFKHMLSHQRCKKWSHTKVGLLKRQSDKINLSFQTSDPLEWDTCQTINLSFIDLGVKLHPFLFQRLVLSEFAVSLIIWMGFFFSWYELIVIFCSHLCARLLSSRPAQREFSTPPCYFIKNWLPSPRKLWIR